MATLFDKVGLLVSANLHDLVNKALRANSVAVLNEQLRRGQESMEQLDETVIQIESDRRREFTKNFGMDTEIEQMTANIKTFMLAGNESRAATIVKQKMTKVAAEAASTKAIEDMDRELVQLRRAQDALSVKLDELKLTRDNVERALALAKSKNQTVETINDVTDILRDDGAIGIGEWAEKLNTTADVRLEHTLAKHNDLLDPMADDNVAAEMERLKAELGLNKLTEETTTDLAAAAAAGTEYTVKVTPKG